MTIQETGAIMEILNVAYPRFYAGKDAEYRRNAVALWAEMFKDYPAKLVAYAVKAFIAEDTSGFPPVIGQILDKVSMLTEEPQMTESEAWALVYKAICNSGYHSVEEFEKLPKNVQKAVHSPEQLRAWGMDQNFNAGVESSNFKRVYRMVCEREKKFNALPEDIKRLMQEKSGDKIEKKLEGEENLDEITG